MNPAASPPLDGAPRTVVLVKGDIVGWTKLSKTLGDGAAPCKRAITDAVEHAVSGFGPEAGSPSWTAEGDAFAAYFAGPDGEARAVRAALAVVRSVRPLRECSYEAQLRIGVGADLVPLGADLSEASPPGFNLAGHLTKRNVCPPSAVCVTEDVLQALRLAAPELAAQFSYLGTTVEDSAPAFAAPAGRQPGESGGLRPAQEDPYPALDKARSWHSRPPFSQLRFYALPQFNFVGSLDLLRVYTPLKLRPRQLGRALPDPEAGVDISRGRGEAPPIQRREPAAPVDLPQALRQSRAIVVLGNPGAGKTTLLRYMAVSASAGRPAAMQRLGLDECLFPLYATAGELLMAWKRRRKVSLDLFAAIYGERADLPAGALSKGLAELAASGRLLILVDGLDEMPRAEDRLRAAQIVEGLAHAHVNCRMVAASRSVGYPGLKLPGVQEFEVESLRPQQTRDLARALYVEALRSSGHDDAAAGREGQARGEDLAQRLLQRDNLGAFAENPLLLALAFLVHWQKDDLPRYRARLYEIAVQTLGESWAKARHPLPGASPQEPVDYETEGRPVLGRLAFHLHSNCPGNLVSLVDLLKLLASWLAVPGTGKGTAGTMSRARSFLDRVGAAGLLIERGPGQWGFLHQTFQEYLAARHWTSHDLHEDPRELSRILYHPRWEEVLRLSAGILSIIHGRWPAAGKFLRSILQDQSDWRARDLKMNLHLAAKCAADTVLSDSALQNEIVEGLALDIHHWAQSNIGYPSNRLSTLQQLRGTPLATDLARRLVQAKEWSAGKIKALAALNTSEGTSALVSRFNAVAGSPASFSESHALIRSLSDLGAQEAIPKLRELLASKDFRWGSPAVEALAALDVVSNQDVLISALEGDEDDFARAMAASALHAIGTPEAVAALARCIVEDPEPYVKFRAAQSLAELGDLGRTEPLKRALDSSTDPRRRLGPAMALGLLGRRDVIPLLLDLLAMPDLDAGFVITETLASMKALEAADRLMDMLQAPSARVRARAAKALGELGVAAAIPSLLKLLSDENLAVREPLIETLAKLGARQAIPAILGVLRSTGPRTQWFHFDLVSALARLGATEAVPDVIRLWRRSDNHFTSSDVLGSLDPKGSTPLLLNHFRKAACANCADALWSIASNHPEEAGLWGKAPVRGPKPTRGSRRAAPRRP